MSSTSWSSNREVPDASPEFTIRPVGYVHSEITGKQQMPVWGAPAWVEILPEYGEGLLRIEKHSHLWVFGWLAQGRDERHVLQVTPRGVTDPGPNGLHGVFAVRSPARPNPIALTVAKVVSLDGLKIHFDRLDFLDGTPVLDIKPYFATRDLIFSASGWQVGKPRSREELRDSLTAQALRFHGQPHPDLALAVRILEHYRWSRVDLNDPGSYRVTVPADRPVLIDGMLGVTRSTPGRGTMQFGPVGTVLVEDVTYRLRPADWVDMQAALDAPDEALFEVS